MSQFQGQLQAATIYRAGNRSANWVQDGKTDGWMPVFAPPQPGAFASPQVGTTAPANDEAIVTLSDAATRGAVIDLAGADGVALQFAGIPAGAGTFGLYIALLEPVKANIGEKPIAYNLCNITYATNFQFGSNFGPGAIEGQFGLTSAHRWCASGAPAAGPLGTGGSSTSFVSVPNIPGSNTRKGRMHIWAGGAPYLLVSMWKTASGDADQLQALYRPICVNEVRGSVLNV